MVPKHLNQEILDFQLYYYFTNILSVLLIRLDNIPIRGQKRQLLVHFSICPIFLFIADNGISTDSPNISL